MLYNTVLHHHTEMQPHGVIVLLSLGLKINSLKITIINRLGTLLITSVAGAEA